MEEKNTESRRYPEHEKLRAIKDQSQAVGEFIEWLEFHGYYICERREAETDSSRIERIKPEGRVRQDLGDLLAGIIDCIADQRCAYWPTMKRLPNALLAEFFEIDEDKLETEKREMIEACRRINDDAVL